MHFKILSTTCWPFCPWLCQLPTMVTGMATAGCELDLHGHMPCRSSSRKRMLPCQPKHKWPCRFQRWTHPERNEQNTISLHFMTHNLTLLESAYRADSTFVPSQWETALLCNVSHWLGASLESALWLPPTSYIIASIMDIKWFHEYPLKHHPRGKPEGITSGGIGTEMTLIWKQELNYIYLIQQNIPYWHILNYCR